MKKQGFTLIELLVVVGIIAILVAILLPAVAKAKEQGRKVTCGNNLKEIAVALQNYAEDFNDMYPLAAMDPLWEQTQDHPTDPLKRMGWMRRLFPYVGQQWKVYKCPSFARNPDYFNYFLGTRAGFANRYIELAGAPISEDERVIRSRVATKRGWIEFPSAHVLGGDCNRQPFAVTDCDRDDYTQPCLGWSDMAAADTETWWEPWHNGGLNVIFADTHVKWFVKETPNEMTYAYHDYRSWENAILP